MDRKSPDEWLALAQEEDAMVDNCRLQARPLHGRRATLYALYALYEQRRQQTNFDLPVTVQGDLNIR